MQIFHTACLKKFHIQFTAHVPMNNFSLHCSIRFLTWKNIFSPFFSFLLSSDSSLEKITCSLRYRHRYDAKRMFISSSRVQPVRMSFAFFLCHSTSAFNNMMMKKIYSISILIEKYFSFIEFEK